MSSLCVSVDPGKWKMGVAGSHQAMMVWASPVYVSRPWSQTKAVKAVLDAVEAYFGTVPPTWHIEHPQVYGGMGRAASKKDVKALEDLAGRFRRELKPLGVKVVLLRPHAWKGNVTKEVHHRRIRRALTPAEVVLLDRDYGDAHSDVWDAIGIELFALGRTGRGGTRK